ncbi:MAG: hypothetical protein UU76_C0019G0003 [Parcubacteria group bacterium GW2011_GWC1_41_7]|nr:MAG: hypothetical protein UU76_C0019G0003 [Parcubacteria group bacterium GW2011_GWC1_41_7]
MSFVQFPFQSQKLHWTDHAKMKMSFYGLSENRVKRVLRNPKRYEEGVLEKAVALMQPTSIKNREGKETWNQEIWVMILKAGGKTKVISVWRYPGVAPERSPVPKEILDELIEQEDEFLPEIA